MIMLGKAQWLDYKHVVFGKVIKGMEFCREISHTPTDPNDKPLKKIYIVDCGEKQHSEIDQKSLNSEGEADDG
jgi:cyclophilin family peptidyl-prolyl cis-trans isomerase